MGSEKKLSEISDSLSGALQRIETLQKQGKTSWLSRFRQNLAKNNQHLHSIILAGCVFAVALGRLQQKSEFEVTPPVNYANSGVLSIMHCTASIVYDDFKAAV